MSSEIILKWILFGVTIAGSFLGLASYSFSTFETVSHAESTQAQMDKRLERIENKIDAILLKTNAR